MGCRRARAVGLRSAVEDGTSRARPGLRVVPYDLPDGCVGAYYPEANDLVPLELRDELSLTPAYKSAPVRVVPSEP